MKVHEKCLAVVWLVVGVVAASCAGSSDGASGITPGPVTPSPDQTTVVQAEATPTAEAPTPDPAEQVTDQQRIDAVVAQFEVDVAAGEIDSVFAYDLLDTKINDIGDVTLTVCAWAGDSVFDQVRDSIYRTRVEPDATIIASHISTPVAAGECLNTQLIESALDHINAFDEFIADSLSDPATFKTDPRRALLTDAYLTITDPTYEDFVADGVYFDGLNLPDTPATDSVVADLLWRRLTSNGFSAIEVALCRDMLPEHGIYRDGVLIDDERGADDPGLHSIDSFQLTHDPDTAGGWLVSGRKSVIWSDCFFADSWLEGANIFQPRAKDFEVLHQ